MLLQLDIYCLNCLVFYPNLSLLLLQGLVGMSCETYFPSMEVALGLPR